MELPASPGTPGGTTFPLYLVSAQNSGDFSKVTDSEEDSRLLSFVETAQQSVSVCRVAEDNDPFVLHPSHYPFIIFPSI